MAQFKAVQATEMPADKHTWFVNAIAEEEGQPDVCVAAFFRTSTSDPETLAKEYADYKNDNQ